jgi:hypothetical protein
LLDPSKRALLQYRRIVMPSSNLPPRLSKAQMRDRALLLYKQGLPLKQAVHQVLVEQGYRKPDSVKPISSPPSSTTR